MSEDNNPNNVFAPWDDPNEVPLIRFEGVTKRYGDFTAIDNLTLDIYEREFYALLGPSGCGKTTLLRLLAGFEEPTEGRVLIDGQDISHIPPNQRPVNMMFQSYALFPHMSVEKNIGFGLKQEGKSKSEIDERVNEMLKLVQLQEFAKRKPDQLSGGQRQRVALARSLAKRPKLLLLDEPLGALDKKLRERTQFELMNLQEQLGVTFLIVTHDQEEAMTVASRIAIMDKGLVAQVDTPAVIYEAPKSRYVSDFIGDVNFIEGKVVSHEGTEVVLESALGQQFILQSDDPLPIGSTAWLSIRPEKVAVNEEKPEDRRNVIQGVVDDIAYHGNISTYHVRLSNGDLIKSQMTNHRRLSNRRITWEDKVWLSWTDTAAIALTE
ncbi:MAG: polyamine ABC transporter ATP-binding protein [Proteobacteria bacterium]|nr:MAG: polyamine ABC transporter ATP-binding protein [Pseudomonadota bacterium]